MPDFSFLEKQKPNFDFLEEASDLTDEVLSIMGDPNENRMMLDNTRFFSDELGLRIEDAHTLRLAIGRMLIDKDDPSEADVAKVIKEIKLERYRPPTLEKGPDKGLYGRLWDNIKYNYLNMRNVEGDIQRGLFAQVAIGDKPIESAFTGTIEGPEKTGTFTGRMGKAFGAQWKETGSRKVKQLSGRTRMIGDAIGSKKLSQWSEMMAMAVELDQQLRQDELVHMIPDTGVIGTTVQMIRRPELIVQQAVDMVPMIAEAALGHITGAKAAKVVGKGAKALPYLGQIAGMAEPIVGEVYTEARQQGTPVGEAYAQAYLTGYGEAALENWSLNANVNIFKGAIGQNVKKSMARTATDILLAGGKVYGRGYTEEASQDINARFWELVFSDNKSISEALQGAFTKEALDAGAAGGAMELLFGGVSHVGGKAYKAIALRSRKEKLAKVRQRIKSVEKNEFITDEYKAELLPVLRAKETEIKESTGDRQTFVFDTVEEAQAAYTELVQMGVSSGRQLEVGQSGATVVVETKEEPIPDSFFTTEQEVKDKVDLELAKAQVEVSKGQAKKAPAVEKTEPDVITTRAKETQDTAKEIREHPAYKEALEELKNVAESQELITYFVEPEYRSEIEEQYPEILPYVEFEKRTGSMAWDEVYETIDEFGQSMTQAVLADLAASETGAYDINAEALRMASEMDMGVEVLAQKLAMLRKKGNTTADIDKAINEYKEVMEVEDFLMDRPRMSPKKAGKMVVDNPEIKRLLQKRENAIAALKTKIDQLRADAKVDKARGIGIEKAKANLELLKQKQKLIAQKKAELARLKKQAAVRLEKSQKRAQAKIDRILDAQTFKESLRADVLSMIKAIPKEKQADFINQAFKADTLKKVQNLARLIQERMIAFERKKKLDALKAKIKKTKPNKMYSVYGNIAKRIIDTLGLTKESDETRDLRAELLGMARDVRNETTDLLNDGTRVAKNVMGVMADAMVRELEDKEGRVSIQDLRNDQIDLISDMLDYLAAMNKQEGSIVATQNIMKVESQVDEIKAEIKPKKPLSENRVLARLQWTVDFVSGGHASLESMLDTIAGRSIATYEEWGQKRNAITSYIYDVINEGNRKKLKYARECELLCKDIAEKYGINKYDLVNDKKTVELDGKKVVLSVAELLSIYMHSRSEHNLKVLNKNGMDRIVRKGPNKGRTERIRGFTFEKIDELNSLLTSEQRAFAREIGKRLFDTKHRIEISIVFEELEGHLLKMVDNYWSAARHRPQTPEGARLQGVPKLLESMGFLQERIGTGSPLLLMNFFDTVFVANKGAASYIGMGPALRDVKTVNGGIAETLVNNGWEKESRKINEFIAKIEGTVGDLGLVEQQVVGKLAKWRRRYAKSVFSLNTKIWGRQYTSVALVNAYVESKYMKAIKGIQDQKTLEKIFELSPEVADRISGVRIDREIGDSYLDTEHDTYWSRESTLGAIQTAMKQGDYGKAFTAAQHAGLAGMRFFDTNAICDTFRIAEAEIQDKNPDLDVESQEYKDLLRERFEWLVRHTQPVWHTKDRSLITSSDNELINQYTMFMSQREQIVRMATAAMQRYAQTGDGRIASKMLGSIAGSIALFTLYNTLWAITVRGNDPEDELKQMPFAFTESVVGNLLFSQFFTDAARNAMNIKDHKWARVNVDAAAVSLIEDAVIGAAYMGGGVLQMIDGDPGWEDNLKRGTYLMGQTVLQGRGLPVAGPRDLTTRLRGDKKKKKSFGY